MIFARFKVLFPRCSSDFRTSFVGKTKDGRDTKHYLPAVAVAVVSHIHRTTIAVTLPVNPNVHLQLSTFDRKVQALDTIELYCTVL
jgi:hypothetical protein